MSEEAINLELYFVYALIDPNDGIPFYIGKGRKDRPFSHLTETEETTINRFKYSKIQKIRECNNEPEIKYIEYNIKDEDAAYEKEKYWISVYGRRHVDENGVLTNICLDSNPPSRLGNPHTTETKRKMSLASLGKKKSDSHRKAIGDSKRGPNHPNYGKKLSSELIEKIRAGNIGVKRDEIARYNISIAHSIDYKLIDYLTNETLFLNSRELKEYCNRNGINKTSLTNTKGNKIFKKRWLLTKE